MAPEAIKRYRVTEIWTAVLVMVAIAELLIDKGATVSANIQVNKTSLDWAAEKHHPEMTIQI